MGFIAFLIQRLASVPSAPKRESEYEYLTRKQKETTAIRKSRWTWFSR